MADNTVKVNINVSDNKTVEKLIKNVERLNRELTKSQKLAKSIAEGMPQTFAARTASRRSAVQAASSRGRFSSQAGEIEDYGRGRATVGTGAAGRDFANQAQGLGGLVRVYATYAANLFAVSAAFTALRNAADTSNLVKGLEQLGLASGQNLPKLAKDLETASGGAISLREAMTATAQATSSGMTGENIRRMGVVAKQAAQAMGINMSDALSRLSRGITKLEPELLDELGIFTKLDPAVEAYARSVGKTANSLTDFERRQAFANAAIEEGEKKFGAIALETNPYDKLLATLKNVAQTGLEFINVVLKPLINLLSQSPTALGVGIAAIAAMILKQAIPAITQWRSELKASADTTAALANENSKLYKLYLSEGSSAVTWHGRLLERISTNADIAAKKMNILATASDNTAFAGSLLAFRQMYASISKLPPQVTAVGRTLLFMKGTAVIAATAVNTVAVAFGNVFAIVGLIISAISLVGSLFGKNAAESEKAAESMSNFESAGKNLIRVFDDLATKKPLERLTPQAIAASTTAASELAQTMLQAIQDTDAQIAARNWVDSTINFLARAVQKSDEQVLSKNINKYLSKVLQNSIDSPELAAQRQKLIKGLGLDSSASDEEIKEAFTKGGSKAAELFLKIAKEGNVAAQSTNTFAGNLKELGKTFKDLGNEIMPKGKIVDAILQTTAAFDDFLKIIEGSDLQSAVAMKELVNSTAMLAMIPEDQRRNIEGAGPLLDAYLLKQQRLGDVAKANTDATVKWNDGLSALTGTMSNVPTMESIMMPNQKVFNNFGQKMATATQQELDKLNFDNLKTAFKNAVEGAFKNTSKIIEDVYATAIRKLQIESQKTALNKLTVNEDVINEQTRLAKEEISLEYRSQIAQAKLSLQMESVTLSQDGLRISLDSLKASIDENTYITSKGTAGAPKAALTQKQIDQRTRELEIRKSAVEEILGGKRLTQQDLQNRGMSGGDAARLALQSAGFAIAAQQRTTRMQEADRTREERLAQLQATRSSEAYANAIKVLEDRIPKGPLAQTTEGFDLTTQLRQQISLLKAEQEKVGLDLENKINQIYGSTGLPGERGRAARERLQQDVAGRGEQQGARRTVSSEIEEQLREAEKQERVYKNIADINETRFKAEEAILNSSQLRLNSDKEELELKNRLGLVSEQEYQRQSRLLEDREADLSYQKSSLDLAQQRLSDLLGIQSKIEQVKAMGGDTTELERSKADILEYYAIIEEGEYTAYEALLRRRDLERSFSNRELEWANQLKSAFEGLADAMVEWAKTGKWSAKEVFNSLIEGIVRYEMRLMAHEAWAKARPVIMKFIGSALSSLFGGGPGTASGWSDNPGDLSGVGGGYATGGVFDRGVEKFAKGGAFTNSIVNSPTLFKFAKGTGLMGEAGPEAIMPLKRDSNGNLGVRSNQQKTEVVVNNYSGQPAQAKETTDARGNRRIEVVVGDMTAGELTRNGSSTNRAIRGTFGLQPQLIRR